MVDEQTDVKPTAEVANSVTEPSTVETQAEPKVEEVAAQPEKTEISAETPKAEGEVRKFSGAERRIRELVDEKKSLEADRQSLAEQVKKLTDGYQATSNNGVSPESQIQPGAEILPEDYQKDVAKTADAIVQIRMNQQRVVDNINREANESIKSYPELDPDNKETFDRDLSDSISEATLAYVRSNPTGSVKKFVDKLMKPYMKSLNRAVGKETETVVKQASETALRPTHVKTAERRFEDLTPEEMEKKLGVVY